MADRQFKLFARLRRTCPAILLPLAATCLFPALAAGQAAAPAAIEKGRYGEWILNVASGDRKICFAATQPKVKEPATANRARVLLYISAWPKEGVKSELSIKMGYPIKQGSEVAVTVGKDAFKLFAKDDRAFVSDPTEELKLIEAMKKGSKLVVQAGSEKGTATTDTYSLAGLSQALTAMAANCP